MKEIKLYNRNKDINGIVFVDDEDYEQLNKHAWHLCHDYAQTNIKIDNKYKLKRMHRLIMGEPEGFEIDHIDNNGLNNQKENLRIVTRQQNSMNQITTKSGTSKFKGVSFNTYKKKWTAQIDFNKNHYYLGVFKNEEDAALAYNKKAKELFGEYAYLNIIKE